MTFNNEEKYLAELKKHAGHVLETENDNDCQLIGEHCVTCNKTIQYSILADDSKMNTKSYKFFEKRKNSQTEENDD